MIKLNELIKRLMEIEQAYPGLFEVKANSIDMHFSIIDKEKNILIIREK